MRLGQPRDRLQQVGRWETAWSGRRWRPVPSPSRGPWLPLGVSIRTGSPAVAGLLRRSRRISSPERPGNIKRRAPRHRAPTRPTASSSAVAPLPCPLHLPAGAAENEGDRLKDVSLVPRPTGVRRAHGCPSLALGRSSVQRDAELGNGSGAATDRGLGPDRRLPAYRGADAARLTRRRRPMSARARSRATLVRGQKGPSAWTSPTASTASRPAHPRPSFTTTFTASEGPDERRADRRARPRGSCPRWRTI